MSDFALPLWRPAWVPPVFGAREVCRTMVAVTGLISLAAVVLAVRHDGSRVAIPPVPAAAWRTILKPAQAYALAAPSSNAPSPNAPSPSAPSSGSPWGGVPATYEARYTFEGAREDVLTFGAFDGRQPAIQLRILRRDPASSRPLPPFAALVREAAQAGLAVTHSTLPDLLPTPFGPFEFAAIAASPHDGAALPCAGFRLALDRPMLAISGLACGRRGVAPSRMAVGCLIERLEVAPAVVADDHELVDFFARAAPRTAACAGGGLDLSDEEKPSIGRPATTRKRLRRR